MLTRTSATCSTAPPLSNAPACARPPCHPPPSGGTMAQVERSRNALLRFRRTGRMNAQEARAVQRTRTDRAHRRPDRRRRRRAEAGRCRDRNPHPPRTGSPCRGVHLARRQRGRHRHCAAVPGAPRSRRRPRPRRNAAGSPLICPSPPPIPPLSPIPPPLKCAYSAPIV